MGEDRLQRPSTTGVERALVAALFAVPVVLCVVALLRVANGFERGFDITDEGFYLLSARSPEDVLGVRNFGHYTGLLLRATAHDIAAFRLLGAAILVGFAAAFGIGFQRCLKTSLALRDESRASRAGGLATIVIAALGYYGHFWAPVPSYNWLLLVALLLGFGGLLLWSFPPEPLRRRSADLGGASLGIAIALAFMAKPPSAVALALTGLAWVLLGSGIGGFGRWFAADDRAPSPASWRRFGVATVVGGAGIALVHAVCFDPPVAWYEQLRGGYELTMILGGQQSGLIGRTLRTLLEFPLTAITWAPLWWTVGLLAVGAVVRFTSNTLAVQLAVSAAILALAVTLFRHGAFAGGFDREGLGIGQPMAVLAIGLTTMLVIRRYLAPGGSATSIRATIQLSIFVTLGAIIYGFASTNGVLIQTGGACVFLVAAGMLPARRLGRIPFATFNAVVAVAIVLQLDDNLEHPYRLAASVAAQVEAVAIGVPPSELRFDPPTARYFEALGRAAEAGGFEPGTALIDLTGASPGAAFAIGARAPVQPWLPGSYFGSIPFARGTLARIPAPVRSAAWILTTPDGPRRLPEVVLEEFELDFPARYTRVGEFHWPARNEIQILWRPNAVR